MVSGGNASSLPLVGGSSEPTIRELSRPGRRSSKYPKLDVPEVEINHPAIKNEKAPLPEVSEHDLVMHYSRLAHRNFAADLGFYPLGSCTMKYNPRFADYIASLDTYSTTHPATPSEFTQGSLEVLHILEQYLTEITGMDFASFQPPAGASGELTGLLIIKQFLNKKNLQNKRDIIVPDSAHGTNPASAKMAGFNVVEVATDERGMVNIENLRSLVNENTAGLMLTNPNTGGLFEEEILTISEIIHSVGGLLYYDGANLNAIVGVCRPGDMGFDIVHSNLHKTFATPHGGGGPGSGPVAVKGYLKEYLPGPIVQKDNDTFNWYTPKYSIGRMHGYHGNFLVALRALVYMKLLGKEGLDTLGSYAVLNARYLSSKVSNYLPLAFKEPCMHEFVATVKYLKKSHKIKAYDVGKALLDKGFHSPTIYFPLIVEEALMFEPTETQTVETLDDLAENIKLIIEELTAPGVNLNDYPKNLPIGRPNELIPAKHLTVHWGDFELLEFTE
jgi:glycine dehydrogenase subunit 2